MVGITDARSTVCEFRLICGSSSDADRFLGRYEMSNVPAPGETIGIDGNPYTVVERSWVIGRAPRQDPAFTTFVNIRVSKLFAFESEKKDE